ncbi:Transcriptional regulator of nonfermentable carbon utilization [Coemansia sp. RSA 2399]|nr:Transcriptional regulator of nonfermentable carbon utilization [Coemansia sp. RSA 2399]
MLSYPVYSTGPLSPNGDGSNATANQGAQQQQQQQQQGITLGVNNTVSIPNSLWAAAPFQPMSEFLPLPNTSRSESIGGINNGALSPTVIDRTAAANVQQQYQQLNSQYANLSQQHHDPWSRTPLVHGQNSSSFTLPPPAPIQQSPPPLSQIVSEEAHRQLSRPPTSDPAVYGLNPVYTHSPAEVYSSVTEPYKYYNGFHFFFSHISSRMDKKNVMRVSRAIAHFRPSLVALLRNLTREDLIFMEKSLQRALLEYEKLIGFIGTPTVVWRRSGEIVLVGKEFSILTQWDRQQLINSQRFIFELMDVESAVVYWEQFAVHAFENSEHAVMSECKLLRPDGSIVPCAFSFTIKRDLFGIPMAIIGNFLPIL